MTHCPTRRGALYTCPACGFRAVQTTRGVVVTAPGDPAADHGLAPDVAPVIARLIRRCTEHDMGLWLVERLVRAVEAEYGG